MGLLILAGALWFGIPWVQTTLNTVSTDDAYVNGHVTFVAARVRGQVSRVLVDDNYRVRKGDLLVELDKEPFQIAVAVKKAAVDTATADLQVAKSKVRGIEAEAMSRRRTLQHAMEEVDNQVALLRARIAGVDKSKAELALAQVDFDRAAKLVVIGRYPKVGVRPAAGRSYWRPARTLSRRWPMSIRSAPLWDCRRQPDEEISARFRPTRSDLFLCAPGAGGDDSECGSTRRHPFVRRGAPRMVEAFEKQGNVNSTFARLAADAPDIKQAEAKLEVAKRDLDQAELDLRYCDVSQRSMGSSRAETSIQATMCRLARL